MSAGYQSVTAAATPPPDRYEEACAWCGATPLSCLACEECREFFCTQEHHAEYLEAEAADLRRQNACRERIQEGAVS